MTSESPRIQRLSGTMLPLPGNDIDTDRIIPARFLRAITFEGLERHVFEDDRASAHTGQPHPFDNPAYSGASILVVNRNFGCGSSREHAPQALRGWGIRAVVGESFSEIFFGNSVALGIPCVTVSAEDASGLMDLAESSPSTSVDVDLEGLALTAGDRVITLTMSRAAQGALLSGAWDATSLLRDDVEQVKATAARLPYVSGF
ncbi:MAG: 3-isopropylmalate dehydratase small subunit [Luteitalea sp.]|nr:3-isopropylmalate dehydratase small subunit [Luteitalea sp.]